jgi:hypothetical protein
VVGSSSGARSDSKTGYSGFLRFFSVAENNFFGDPDDQVDPGNPDGYL